MPQAIDQNLIDSLDSIKDPKDLLKKIFDDFGDRAAIGTSGQLSGSALIDMACSLTKKPRIFTIDTLRLFPETYQLFDELDKKYKIQIERVQPDFKEVQDMVQKDGEYLFFDSKEKQEFCCYLRKVKPNKKILSTLDVWITGLRADQSARRAGLSRFELMPDGPTKRPLLKVAPLIDWTEEELRKYCEANQVPVHPLLNWEENGWRYESLGCQICTTPIGPLEARRAGRWRWFKDDESKECGIHVVHEDEV